MLTDQHLIRLEMPSSFHLLGGLRIAPAIEPILGLGFGVPVTSFELHVFAGGHVWHDSFVATAGRFLDAVENP